jgi:hypothetical protein
MLVQAKKMLRLSNTICSKPKNKSTHLFRYFISDTNLNIRHKSQYKRRPHGRKYEVSGEVAIDIFKIVSKNSKKRKSHIIKLFQTSQNEKQ